MICLQHKLLEIGLEFGLLSYSAVLFSLRMKFHNIVHDFTLTIFSVKYCNLVSYKLINPDSVVQKSQAPGCPCN